MRPFRSKALYLARQHRYVAKFARVTFYIFVIFIALLFLPWQQTAYGVGRLTALNPSERDYDIVATYDGVIERFFVRENQFVKKGTPLFRIRDLDSRFLQRLKTIRTQTQLRYENEKDKLERIASNIRHQQEVLQNGLSVYDKKIRQLKTTLDALMQKRDAAKNSVEVARINYKRIRKLYKAGIESRRQFELKQNRYLTVNAELRKVQADINNTETSLEITRNERKQFENKMQVTLNNLQNNLLQIQNNVASLQQQLQKDTASLARFLSNDIKAKSDGYVIRIYQNDTNRLLKKGEKIMTFSPKVTKRVVRLKISDFNMPLIKPGLKVRIIFYGWPAIQISGWPEISHGTFGGVIESIERTSREEGIYYALIAEDPDDNPWPAIEHLRIGTQARIWVRLGVVPIWYELWRLMAAQPPKMINPQVDNVKTLLNQIEAKQ